MEKSHIIESIIQQMSRLPGIGRRSAQRIIFYLMQKKEAVLYPLVEQLDLLSKQVKTCDICNNIDVSNPCSICQNPKRDHHTLCVVEDIAALWAFENSKSYNGLYFVLGDNLSSLQKIPDEINIDQLLNLIKNNKITECIVATSLTVEGQSTSYYLKEQVNLNAPDVIVTCLAKGVPAGGEIEYLDETTLSTALKLRNQL